MQTDRSDDQGDLQNQPSDFTGSLIFSVLSSTDQLSHPTHTARLEAIK
jgi:hypothetical protein